MQMARRKERLAPSVALSGVVLLATWMGYAYGGYFAAEWTLATVLLAVLVLILALAGLLRGVRFGWSAVALGSFAGYAAWTFASILWSPNRGDAWAGAGQTLLYVLVFGITIIFLTLGASRRWVLAASVLGPAILAIYTLRGLTSRPETYLEDARLNGTVGYHNSEAAFLLVTFWVAVYLGGSRGVNPLLRGLVLAGATFSVEMAVLTQSRGALVAMALSLPVFFLFSGQRLRGLIALAPVVTALALSFPQLNAVYLAAFGGGDPSAAIMDAASIVWVSAAVAGLYGILWGILDWVWEPSTILVRLVSGAVLVAFVVTLGFGLVSFQGQVGISPTEWAAQKWEAFKTNDTSGYERSRYLSASGSGRYSLWEVAWKDFISRPVLGIGTHNYEATYYKLRDEPVGYVRQPHMLSLEVLAERGVVGGVLFLGFLATCVTIGLRNRFGSLRAEGRAMVGALAAAVAYWFIHGSAEWFWQMPAVTLPAIVYLALLVAPWQRRSDRAERPPLRWSLRAGVAAAAVLSVIIVAPLYMAQLYLERSEATPSNPWLAIQMVERAQRYNPLDPRLPQREAELRTEIGDWPRAVDAYERAILLNSEHYAPRALLAGFYERHGEMERALSLYREASDLNPLDGELRTREKVLENKVQ